jgi:hypothetical protein
MIPSLSLYHSLSLSLSFSLFLFVLGEKKKIIALLSPPTTNIQLLDPIFAVVTITLEAR